VGIRQHFREGILHNATWMLSGKSLQLAGALAYFVIVAHALGPAGYGAYVSCTALLAALSPFATLGTANVMVKYVARDRNALPVYFGNALVVTLACGSLLVLFALAIRSTVLPVSATATMLIAVAIADLLATQVTTICAQVFLALEEASRYARVLTWSTGLRVIAAIVMAISFRTPTFWAIMYATAAVIAASGGLITVIRYCERPRFQPNIIVCSVREGFHFATSTATQSVYNDIDKTMLASLSSAESAAIYAVAYRFIEAAMLPIYSTAAATYPEFFRRGMGGVTPAFAFARRIIRFSLVYALAIALALLAVAGLIPLVMGSGYAEGAVALRYLCLLPVFKSMHSFLTDTLTGANYQWQRSFVQIVVAIFNVLINLWIIRAFSWRGAAYSSLVTDLLLVVLLYLVIRWHLKRERSIFNKPLPQPEFAIGNQ
jgi:O-antigen/teichoic acid export membrane protein